MKWTPRHREESDRFAKISKNSKSYAKIFHHDMKGLNGLIHEKTED
jgi:hypothetical protein